MANHLRDAARLAMKTAERHARTDMGYVARNGFWLTLNHVGIGLIALGLSVAFAHFLPKDVYGEYRFLLSLFWILAAFSLTGVAPALMRAVARGDEGAYFPALKTSILWSFPMALIGLAGATYYFVNANATLGWGLVAIALVGPFMQGAYLFGAFQEGRKAFKENAIAGIVLNGIPALALIAIMPFIHEPPLFMAIYLGASVATGFLISWFVIGRRNVQESEETAEFRSLSRHFSILNILGTLSQQIDRILVFHFLGAVELAVYALAVALPEQVKGVVGSVEALAFPKFAQKSARAVLGNFWGRMLLFTLLLAIVAAVYILLAPYLFALLFPKYPEAVIYSQIFAISLLFLGNVLPPTLFQAQAAKRELYLFTVVTSVFQILILIPCIAYGGLMGAVIARVVARAFNLGFGALLVATYDARTR